MKFICVVANLGSGKSWEEEFDEPQIHSQAEAESWAIVTVKRFNETLRIGEKPRKVLAVKIISEDSDLHDWEKTSLVTINDPRLGLYDRMACRNCCVTGKRYGLGGNVKIDSRFKAKKFQKCSTAKIACREVGN